MTWGGLAGLTLLVLLRFFRLDLDPPLFFATEGKSQLTDPYFYTWFARSAVLFGDWDLYDYQRWDMIKYTLVSGVSFLSFKLFGVSRITANLVAVFLSLGGITFMLLGLHRRSSKAILPTAATALLASVVLFAYGRLPYLENGLIFLAGLTFFLYMRFRHRWYGLLAVGFTIMQAALLGKLFGGLMFVPAVVCLADEYRKESWRPILIVAGGGLIGLAGYLLLFFGGSLTSFLAYLGEINQVFQQPPGLASILNFLIYLMAYFGLGSFSELSGMLVLMALSGTLLFVLNRDNETEDRTPVVFAITWLFTGLLLFAPQPYRPLRYALFLMLPMSVLAGYFVSQLSAKQFRIGIIKRKAELVFIFLVSCLFVAEIVAWSGGITDKTDTVARFLILIGIAGSAITAIVYFLMQKRLFRKGRVWRIGLIVVLALFYVGQNSRFIHKSLTRPGKHLAKFNEEIGQILGKHAIISGTYGAAVTIDNTVGGVFDYFGPFDGPDDFFERYPVTHLALENANWKRVIRQYPIENKATKLATALVRATSIDIYRLNDATTPPTDYERSVMYYLKGDYDSASVTIERFLKKHPNNRSAIYVKANILTSTDRFSLAMQFTREVAERFATDYSVQLFASKLYGYVYYRQKSPQVRQKAIEYLARAKELNQHVKLTIEDVTFAR